MYSMDEILSLYLVTDDRWLNGRKLENVVKEAIEAGVTCVQLRAKDASKEEIIKQAKALKEVCHQYHVPLIINDHVDICIEVGADGVHVGQSDLEASKARELLGPDKIIGVTAKTIEQATNALKAGANYLGVGAVFGTTTKLDAKKITIDDLKAIKEAVNLPIVAIGGIEKDNAILLKGSCISGIAVVSAIMASPDIKADTNYLRQIVEDIKND